MERWSTLLTWKSTFTSPPNLRLVSRAGAPSSARVSSLENRMCGWGFNQHAQTKLKLLWYLVHTIECLAKYVHKSDSGGKPSRCFDSSSSSTIPATQRAFTIFCFFSLPQALLLLLSYNPLPFKLMRILSSQTRAQSTCTSSARLLLKTEKPCPETAESLSCLNPHSLNCRYGKDCWCCSYLHSEEGVPGDTTVYSSSTEPLLTVITSALLKTRGAAALSFLHTRHERCL